VKEKGVERESEEIDPPPKYGVERKW